MVWVIDHHTHILTILLFLSEILGLQNKFKVSSISGILLFVLKLFFKRKP